jgi:H+-translocating NAD(P) transhydrogenase subunit alpha
MLIPNFMRFAVMLLLVVIASSTALAVDAVLPDAAHTITQADSASSGFSRNDAVIASLTIFVLAIFVGNEIITKVPPTLHTPLMSGSNAISGISLVGALIVAGFQSSSLAVWLGLFAVIFATINVIGGFLVTHRMLAMFKRK